MGEENAQIWFSRTQAVAVIGLLTSVVLGLVGVGFMYAGVLPEVTRESEGFRVEYAISAVGIFGIIAIIGSLSTLTWTLFSAIASYRKGVAVQLEQNG